jgi:uncharacterized protein
MTKIVKCPTCGKNVEWTNLNKFRPFCSERCKLIDLGSWASGQNSISTPLTPKDLDRPDVQAQIEEYINNSQSDNNENEHYE